MPVQYKYRAIAADGSVRSGTITAQGEAAVESILERQELVPVDISLIAQKAPTGIFGFLKSVDYEQLIVFTNSLSSLYKAGIPLLRALKIIRVGRPGSRFNYVIDEIHNAVESGKLLSEAMRVYPDVFSSVFVNCVAAGEESGQLDQTLDELSDMLERDMELNRQIKSGTRYPIMVICAIVAAFFVLMNFVIPKFVSFYAAFGSDLPLPTKIIMGISNFVTAYWWLLLAGLAAAILSIRTVYRSPGGRLWIDRMLLKLPVFGGLMIKGNVARVSLLFRILISSGLPLVKSLEILAGTVKNTVIGRELRMMADMFRRGKEIDVLDGKFEFFPDQALQMLAIGLESGNMDVMLGQIGEYYTKQVFYTSRQLTSIIEPILTLVLGGFILILALAIFLPMWNLIKVFQG
ncbi:MAG: type II secretion system F family protein [candidate division Zixibacteria bacterium]|nr:type II secretion system F family protein [candidate division Zixibacteria bacterium]